MQAPGRKAGLWPDAPVLHLNASPHRILITATVRFWMQTLMVRDRQTNLISIFAWQEEESVKSGVKVFCRIKNGHCNFDFSILITDDTSLTECVVCMKREASIALPCGHQFLSCYCANRVIEEFGSCPLCRHSITDPQGARTSEVTERLLSVKAEK